MKVSHSTRTAKLQLVDPACAAAQEHVEARISNFHFLSVFLPSCGYGVFRQLHSKNKRLIFNTKINT